jgi:hypothetical protein
VQLALSLKRPAQQPAQCFSAASENRNPRQAMPLPKPYRWPHSWPQMATSPVPRYASLSFSAPLDLVVDLLDDEHAILVDVREFKVQEDRVQEFLEPELAFAAPVVTLKPRLPSALFLAWHAFLFNFQVQTQSQEISFAHPPQRTSSFINIHNGKTEVRLCCKYLSLGLPTPPSSRSDPGRTWL